MTARIGGGGRTLREMLEESDAVLARTGRYMGLERLALKERRPLHYEKLFARLRGGLVAARETARNISASPIVKELGELCFALYTPEGDSVVLSTGIVAHVHTMSEAIKWMIRHGYEDDPGIRDGDIFCNNDSFIGDVHRADVQSFVPIFWDGELVAWAAGVTHVIDIGAINPGSSPVGPLNRYHDGIHFPAQKVGANDRVFQDHAIRCRRGVRTPQYFALDERTRIAGCHMVREAVTTLVAAEGVRTFKGFVREVIEEGRRTFLARMRELTIPGRYHAPTLIDVPFAGESRLPAYAATDTLMHAPMTVEITAEGVLRLGMPGASPWGHHSFNCSPVAMQGALWVLLTQTIMPNDKVNDGSYLATRSDFPVGAWCNPDTEDVSTCSAWVFLQPAFSGLLRSLSRAFYARGFLEEVSAGYATSQNALMGGGVDADGRVLAFSNFEISCVGGGAGAVKDGLDHAAAMWNPEGDMGDVEGWEALEPLCYLGRRVKPCSAGPGRFRGGSGFESLRLVGPVRDLGLHNIGPGRVFASPGLFGGYPGAAGYRLNVHDTNMAELVSRQQPYPVRDHDPEDSEVEATVTGRVVRDQRCTTLPEAFREGDLYLSYLRGGPGLGDPLERHPLLVAHDLEAEVLLPRFAAKVYGVVARRVDGGRWEVDPVATTRLRREKLAERLTRGTPVAQWRRAEREKLLAGDLDPTVRETYRGSMRLSPGWAAWFRRFWDLPDDFEFAAGTPARTEGSVS